jgi:hypothetical protein
MRTKSRALVTVVVAVLLIAGAVAPWARTAGDPEVRPTAEVLALDGRLDSGLIYLVADGTKTRIQQPRAATFDELDADVVEEVATLGVADAPTGSQFVVVPPDGPDAALYLLVDGVLDPVEIHAASQDSLDALPDADQPAFDHLEVLN